MTTLIVIRHPPVLDRDLCYGRTDPPCAVTEEELSKLHRILDQETDLADCQLWSSPAKRCWLLTRSLEEKYARKAVSDPRLWELSMGVFEGRHFGDLENDPAFQRWMKNWQIESTPDGESTSDLVNRVTDFCSELTPNKTHLIVAHAGVIRSLWVLADGLTFEKAMRRPVPHLTPLRISLKEHSSQR